MIVKTLLESFKPEHEFAGEVPAELAAFANALSDLGLKTEIQADWVDGYPMSRFIERWENVQPENQTIRSRYPKDTFDQVGLALKLIFAD